ncbi:hypothetical protein JCM18899A_27030 [Nocardioides sp. AN3]
MSDLQRGDGVDLSDILNADLLLGNSALAASAWFGSRRLSGTAKLFLSLSAAHGAASHQIARRCGQAGLAAHVCALAPPRADFVDALDAAQEILRREQAALAALDHVARASTTLARGSGALVAAVLQTQRTLTRASSFLERGTARHGSDAGQLERWALREARRFHSLLAGNPPRVDTYPSRPRSGRHGRSLSKEALV